MWDVAKTAKAALIQAGAVTPCEHHKAVLLHHDVEDAERKADFLARLWLKQEGVMFMHEDIQDAFKSILDGSAKDGCPECARQKDS